MAEGIAMRFGRFRHADAGGIMPERSAGLLMYRWGNDGLEVFLGHPGGPFFKHKDAGAWSIPKGVPRASEPDLLEVAIREFREETGMFPRARGYLPLGTIRQRGGKEVHAWAFEGEWHGRELRSNTFELEWPPRSGKVQQFPELDHARFFPLQVAREKINPSQRVLLDRLAETLDGRQPSE